MTADVISYHGAHRKRRADDGVSRRLAIILVAALAVCAGLWLQRPASVPPAPPPPAPAPVAPLAPAPTLTPAVEMVPPPPPAHTPRPARRRPAPIPLDAQGENFGEDLEILSAAELDAISQARD